MPSNSRHKPFGLAIALLVLMGCGESGSSRTQAEPAIAGTWSAFDGRFAVQITGCIGAAGPYCGTIVSAPPGPDGPESMLDARNYDPLMRNRPLIGVNVLDGLREENGAWRGRIYLFQSLGLHAEAIATPRNNDELSVKTCISGGCSEQFWIRTDL